MSELDEAVRRGIEKAAGPGRMTQDFWELLSGQKLNRIDDVIERGTDMADSATRSFGAHGHYPLEESKQLLKRFGKNDALRDKIRYRQGLARAGTSVAGGLGLGGAAYGLHDQYHPSVQKELESWTN